MQKHQKPPVSITGSPEGLAILSRDQYKRLEAQVANSIVTQSTTELEAGFKLGVQHVLTLLRNGFVYGT